MIHVKRNIPIEIIVWIIISPLYLLAVAFFIMLVVSLTFSQSPKKSVRMYRELWQDRHKKLVDYRVMKG